MKRSISSSTKAIAPWVFWLSFLAAIAISLLPYWPENKLFSVVGYLLLFAPRWWIFILPLSMLLIIKQLKLWQRITIIPVILISLSFIDISWLPNFNSDSSDQLEIPIISVNIGNSSNKSKLKENIERYRPYLVLLQEARKPDMEQLFDDEWNTNCSSTLCIASRLPIKKTGVLDRSELGGWGSYAAKYEIDFLGETLQLINVHLDTPRSILESLIHLDISDKETEQITFNRNIEANLVSNWIDEEHPAIIAGDFNMPTNENIYQRYLGRLNNGLDSSEIGFRYTKYTKWHGIRIDHILYNDFFVARYAKVLEDFGGDHRPVFTVLRQHQ